MKLESIQYTDAEDNKVEVPMKDYVKGIATEFEVPKEVEFENVGAVPAPKIILSIIKAVSEEKEVSEDIVNCDAFNFSGLIAKVTADVEGTKAALVEAKDKAKAEKEAAKKAKEEEKARKEKEAAELKVRQEEFVKNVEAGADSAQDAFLQELEGIKSNLPEGVAIVQSGSGFGIAIDEKAGDASIGQAIGYFYQADQNNQFLSNQIQFFIGDLAEAARAKGLFKTAIEAGKAISAYLETQGKRLGVQAIETYRRMATRTPVEMRNPKADPTAYLELTKMKRPKKGDDEKKEDFEKRSKKFEDEINKVMEKLRDGAIVTRKDVIPLAQEVKYTAGLEERPDPNAPKELGVVDLLRIYALGKICLEEVVSIDEDGEEVEDRIAFTHNKKVHWIDKNDLRAMIEEAEVELKNKFLKGKNFTVEDVCRGYTVEMKQVPIGTDAEGKAISEEREVKVPVLLPAFFPIEEEEEETQEPAAEESAPKKAAKKAGKK